MWLPNPFLSLSWGGHNLALLGAMTRKLVSSRCDHPHQMGVIMSLCGLKCTFSFLSSEDGLVTGQHVGLVFRLASSRQGLHAEIGSMVLPGREGSASYPHTHNVCCKLAKNA